NFYVAGLSNQLAKLDPSDNSSIVSTALSSPRAVAINGSGQAFIANAGNGTITRFPATPSATFASGLDSPYGLVFDAAGTLYASENGTTNNRVVAFDAAGNKTVVAESVVTTPHDIYVAPNG